MQYNLEKNNGEKQRYDLVFRTFCVWSFILLCRPQDYAPVIKALHPGLASTAVMVFVFICNYGKFNEISLFNSKQIRYFLLFYSVMIIGIPFSMHVGESFHMIFFSYVMYVIYFMIFYKVIDTVHKLKSLFFICCFGCGIFYFFTLSSFKGGRLGLGMFDPNDICLFVFAFLPLNLLFIGKNYSAFIRLIFLSISISGVLIIFFSGSRGGLLALICLIAIFIIKTDTIRFTHKLFMIIFVLIALSVAPIKYDRFLTMFNIEDDYNVHSETGRLAIWETGVELMVENPLTGVGVNSFGRAFGYNQEAKGSSILMWKVAHNSVVQVGTETGIIGLFLFVVMIINVLRIFNKALKESIDQELIKIVSLGRLGFIGMFVSSMFVSFGYSVYFVLYFAFSAVINRFLEENLNHKVEAVL